VVLILDNKLLIKAKKTFSTINEEPFSKLQGIIKLEYIELILR